MSAARTAALWVLVSLMAGPASAHHSGAIFDSSKSVTLQGTVREFQWTNPHCWIQLVVPGAAGAEEEWSVEMGAPLQLFQAGWKPGTLKPGDEIVVVLHPIRDGSKGGLFVSAMAKDGAPIGRQR
jgi:hypothetical protein